MSLAARIQTSNATKADRHPAIFRHAAEVVKGSTPSAKVLSFGCSTGLEAVTLADIYFDRAGDTILGVDISDYALGRARTENAHPRIRYEFSTDEMIASGGPFDAIFAMAVLCLWPDTEHDTFIGDKYPFKRFEATVADLDNNLKIGGVLVVANSNYAVEDVSFFGRYQPLPTPLITNAGFVKRFKPGGFEETAERAPFTVFQKIRAA